MVLPLTSYQLVEGHLIELARQRFIMKIAAFHLPVGASARRDKDMQGYPDSRYFRDVLEHIRKLVRE